MKRKLIEALFNEQTKKMKRCLVLLFLILTLTGQSGFAQEDPPAYCTAGFFWGCGFNGGMHNFNDFIVYGAGISNIDAGCAGGFGDTGAYADYTANSDLQGSLYQGQTYDFMVGAINSNQYIKIWIDLNGNGDFEDSGELVFYSTQGSQPNGMSGSFTIPATAPLLTTRMRVIMLANNPPYAPCGLQEILGGGVHDYQVTILSATECYTPSGVSVSNISDTSADISWTGNGTSFDIEYGESGFTQGNGTPANGIITNNHTLTGLTAAATYHYYIRQNCGADGYSDWTGPYTFKTLCTPVDSFFEDFDAFGAPSEFFSFQVPDCWDGILMGGTLRTELLNATTENYHIRQSSDSPENATIAVLPPVTNINAGTHWLRFNAYTNQDSWGNLYEGVLQIGYVTDVDDADTFVEVLPININNIDPDEEYMAVFPTTTPANARIAIRNPGNSTSNLYWDDIYWESKPACVPPLNITAGNFTQTTADLNWVSDGTIFDIEYGETGFTQGTGTMTNGVGNPYTVTGLSPFTEYEYYVRQDCDSDGYSTWSGPFGFRTLCTAVDTIIEDFDDITTEYSIPAPDCWDRIISGSGNLVVTTSGPPAASGTYRMRQGSSTPSDATIAVLPPVTNINSGNHWLRFKAVVWIDSQIGYLQVGYITDIENPSSFVETMLLTINDTDWSNSEYIVPFTSDTPANARIAVRNPGTSSVEIYWDDVYWEPTTACIFPINPKAINISEQSTSLSWTSDGTLFDIEYGLEGFEQGQGTTLSGVSNPYTLSGLTANQTYQYYVRRDCGNGDYSIWTGPFTFTSGVYQETIPTMLNANPSVNDDACANSFSIEVPEGQQIASLNVQYTMTSSAPALDTHQRSVLYSSTLEMGEPTVALAPNPQDFPGVVYYNRAVEFANGATGTIDFELKAWRTEGGSGCGTNLVYVENGSWILNATFEDIPSCPNPPTNLGYDNVTVSSVDLVWTSTEAGTFQLKWGDVGFNVETAGTEILDINAFSQTLSGLDSTIPYEFYVRRDCSDEDEEDYGEWIGPVRFNSGHCIPYSDTTHGITVFHTTNAIENVTYTNQSPFGNGFVDKTDEFIVQEAGESFDFTSSYIGGAHGLRIWVDWNNDFIFDEDEIVFENISSNGSNPGVIEIPEDAAGNYRMRVRAQGNPATLPSACGEIPYGEAIDFTLSIPCDEIETPTGEALQYFTEGDTLADLEVTGDNLVWYADEDLTVVLDESTLLVHNETYYVVSTNGDCQSEFLAVTVEEELGRIDFETFGFKYYPNPVSELLYLSANTPISDVTVINMLGQQIDVPVNSDNTSLDMSELPTGNYLIKVTIEGVSKMFKVVKQ